MALGTFSRVPLPRRSLLNWFFGAGVGAFTVSTLSPGTRSLIPPPRPLEEYTVRARGDRVAVSRTAPA